MGTSRGLQQPHQSRWYRRMDSHALQQHIKEDGPSDTPQQSIKFGLEHTHIMQSGEYDHQTTSVKEWISSFRNLRIRRP
eukprot:565088-Amphidinium_carterae.1